MNIVFHAAFIASKQGKTGLSPTVNVWRIARSNGASTQIVTGSAAGEVGGGLYAYVLTGADLATYDYVAQFVTADATVDQQHVFAMWTRFSEAIAESVEAIEGKTATIGSGKVTVVSPVTESNVLTIVRGDDYADADGRALEWINEDGTWPDLTGATIRFTAKPRDPVVNQTIEATGTVVTPTGANQKVRVELTSAETEVTPGSWTYDVEATLANGRIVTLALEKMTVREDISI